MAGDKILKKYFIDANIKVLIIISFFEKGLKNQVNHIPYIII
jgi:hypothetical protein